IDDLDVTLDVTHVADQALRLYLISPSGTRVALVTHLPMGANLQDTRLDDEAENALANGVAPFHGRFRPEASLSAFDGEDPNGAWTLEILDSDLVHTGTLDGWNLALTLVPSAVVVEAPELPVVIDGLVTAVTTLTVAGFAHPLFDLDVALESRNMWGGDLRTYLISPAGTRVELFSTMVFSWCDFRGTILDDTAPLPIMAGMPPFTGRFRPVDSLAAFQGEDPNGVWQLEFTSPWGVSGVLEGWSLRLTPATQTVSVGSADAPLATMAAGAATSTLTVTGFQDPLADVDVTFNLTHGPDDTIRVFLTSPSGTRVELFGPWGGSGGSFRDTTLDDEAPAPLADSAAPFTGRYRPQGSLAAFDGENPNGIWRLEMLDTGLHPTDVLESWSLSLTPVPPSLTEVVADGLDVPLDIPYPGPVSSQLLVQGCPGRIFDLDVTVDIAHAWDGDLSAYLISPSGTRVALFANVGGSGDDFRQTTLDDAASVPIGIAAAPFTGRFRPAGQLSAFAGEEANGLWTLELSDNFPADSGVLQHWSLSVLPLPPPSLVASGDVPVQLGGAAKLTSTLNIQGLQAPLYDVDVTLDMTHPRSGDLLVNLVSPTGTRVELIAPAGTQHGTLDNWTLRLTPVPTGPTLEAGDVPRAIVDVAMASAVLAVEGFSGTLADLDVNLDLTHSTPGNLIVYLASPSGTRVELFGDLPANGADLRHTTLDDQAPVFLVDATAPYTGRFCPQGSLSAFAGENPNGLWTLEMINLDPAHPGTLNGWSLSLTPSSSVQLSVLGNDGHGGFAATAAVSLGSPVTAMLAFDIDGDGLPDLALADQAGQQVRVLRNRGGGDWASPASYPLGTAAMALASADLNGDGFADLITGNASDSVSVLLNRGNGTFAEAVSYPNGAAAVAVIAPDVTGDGVPDVAVVRDRTNDVAVLRNDGQGVLQPLQTISLDGDPRSIVAGDFDADGDQDLAVAVAGLPRTHIATAVPRRLMPGTTLLSEVVVDGRQGNLLDLDLTFDITHSSTGAIDAYLISPSGRRILLFESVGAAGPNFQETTLDDSAAIDIVGEGAPFHGSYRPYTPLSSFRGEDPNGTWKLEVHIGTYGYSAGMLNHWSLIVTTEDHVTILVNDGQGGFSVGGSMETGGRPENIISADLDGDGHDDLLVLHSGSTTGTVLVNDGHGGFSKTATLRDGFRPLAAAVDNVLGDAQTRIAIADAQGYVLTREVLTGESALGVLGALVRPGVTTDQLDFGSQAVSAQIQGRVFNDANGNRKKDDSELGLPNWRIYVDENQNGVWDKGELFGWTGADGSYSLPNLAAGDYDVLAEPQAGWEPPVQLNVLAAHFTGSEGQPATEGFTSIGLADLWHVSTGRGNADGHSPEAAFYFGRDEGSDGGGTFWDSDRGTLSSPLIDLRGASGTIVLDWNQLLDLDLTRDLAEVCVRQGNDLTVLASTADRTLPTGGGFAPRRLDLSAFAGQQIQLLFRFEAEQFPRQGQNLMANLVAGQEYFIHVGGVAGAAQPRYDLRVSRDKPDLAFTAFEITGVGLDGVNYRYTITNLGTQPADLSGGSLSLSSNLGLQNWYSTDSVLGGDFGCGGSIIGIWDSKFLAPGESFSSTYSANFPPWAAGTQSQYQLIVEMLNVVDDADDSNNYIVIPIVRPTIPADALEPNNDFATAMDLGMAFPQTRAGLSLHAVDDVDFFRYQATASGAVNISVYSDDAPWEVQLRVYDSARTPLASSYSGLDQLSLVLAAVAGETYFLEVRGSGQREIPHYSLVLGSTEVPPDSAEPNDSFSDATSLGGLGWVERADLTIHNRADVDYFSFQVESGASVEIRLLATTANANLDLLLYDAEQNVLASATAIGSAEDLQHSFVAGGTYYLKVVAATADSFSAYHIWLNGPIAPDRFEANNTWGAATDLGTVGSRSEPGLTMHVGDSADYFRFVPAVSGTYVVDLGFDPSRGDLEVGLYDADGHLVTSSEHEGWYIDDVTVRVFGKYKLTLKPGELRADVDFGQQALEGATGVGRNGTIEGILFDDADGDRVRDAAEGVLANVEVFLDVNNNGQADAGEQTRTKADGSYRFTGLGPGVYTVAYVPPATTHQTFPVRNELSILQQVPTGDGPQSVVLADLNGDQVLDMAVANSGAGNVSILRNDGHGHFLKQQPDVVTGTGASSVAAVDLDRDGDLDLVVANLYQSDISILLNDGAGGFTRSRNVVVGTGPSFISTGQFNDDNHDGRIDQADFPDVAVTTLGESQGRGWDTGSVAILLGDGSGSLSAPIRIKVGVDPYALVTGHFNDDNGDGKIDSQDYPDLAVANFGPYPGAGSVSVLFNRGDGTFGNPTNLTAEQGTYAVISADLDADGRQDLVAVNALSDSLSIFRSTGNGTFGPATTIPLGTGATSVTAEDLDGDGDLDLAVSNGRGDGVVILQNRGNATFESSGIVGVADLPEAYSFSVASGDVDGDGNLDLAVAKGRSDKVTVLHNAVLATTQRVRLGVDATVADIDFGNRHDNRSPTDILLSNQSVTETASTYVPVIVGDLTASDLDGSERHGFELVAGEGDTDNGAFQLAGTQLQ
ncbi:MAG: proprotein convertase P-domain-containing protein, partial [Planctomycetota bacterium]|nr:proprotein convertase P-domain-containing protein [Planctomycetota bacterium]